MTYRLTLALMTCMAISASAFTNNAIIESHSDEVEALEEDGHVVALAECWLAQPKLEPLSTIIASGKCGTSSEIRPQYIWSIAKKALIWGLRHHTDTIVKKLPKKWQKPVKKYAGKLANLIETFEDWKEGACIIGMTGMGIPPSDAALMCQAISWLL